MPRGDKTGPNGAGPKTGRALGYCVGNNHAGFETENANYGRGFGRGYRHGNGYGRGMDFGYRHGFNNAFNEDLTDVKEKTLIENEINILKDKLEALESRKNLLTASE